MSTETPEMRPEDVPAEWVALAKEADLAHIHRRLKTAGPGAGGVRPTSDHQTARLIAAVLPAHRAMVIAEIACEPPEGVVVRRDDLETYLNRGKDLAAETAALNRLRAALESPHEH